MRKQKRRGRGEESVHGRRESWVGRRHCEKMSGRNGGKKLGGRERGRAGRELRIGLKKGKEWLNE